jgi:hypothetical protein
MNHAIRLSALSSSPAQGKNQTNDLHNLHMTGGESDFLARRRLLTIESKRIQDSIVEIETEIKARQDHLAVFRDRVTASLGEHLAEREKALREELARRESLERGARIKNLPKNAERFVRRKGKQLLAYLKPASAAISGKAQMPFLSIPGGTFRKPCD